MTARFQTGERVGLPSGEMGEVLGEIAGDPTAYRVRIIGTKTSVNVRASIMERMHDRHEYDDENQAWTVDVIYLDCAHTYECDCYGHIHAGERA